MSNLSGKLKLLSCDSIELEIDAYNVEFHGRKKFFLFNVFTCNLLSVRLIDHHGNSLISKRTIISLTHHLFMIHLEWVSCGMKNILLLISSYHHTHLITLMWTFHNSRAHLFSVKKENILFSYHISLCVSRAFSYSLSVIKSKCRTVYFSMDFVALHCTLELFWSDGLALFRLSSR